MNYDLFHQKKPDQKLGDKAVLLGSWALAHSQLFMTQISKIQEVAPFRFLTTPGGYKMSAAMTCCGTFGWHSDQNGYRYTKTDPLTGQKWPKMPTAFGKLACDAAAQAGFNLFAPDACLINRYTRTARLSLHQDKDEKDLGAPIVSFSFGVAANFWFGGQTRSAHKTKWLLEHGDVVVWGGPSRLNYHGIEKLVGPHHPDLGDVRYNITFRHTGL